MGVKRAVLNWYAKLSPQRGSAVPPFSHVVQIGDPALRRKCDPVPLDKIRSEDVQKVIHRLRDVMNAYGAVGLAAPQIGVNLSIFAMQVTKNDIASVQREVAKVRGMYEVPYTVFINPGMRVLDYTKVVLPEACESIRGFMANVARYKMVEISGYNPAGVTETARYEDWAARIAQHEIDHLAGRLYTDSMDRKTLACTCWEEVNIAQGKVAIPYRPD